MRRKALGTIYLIIGLILSISFPISSVLNGIISIGIYAPIDPLSYWVTWLLQYGLLAITLVIIGVYFVIFGYRYRKS